MRTLGHACCALATLVFACADRGDVCDPTRPDTICTIAGTGEPGAPVFAPVPATEAPLYIPTDVTLAPDGTVWVIDFNNYVLRQIDDAGVMRTVVGNGNLGDCPEGTPALDAEFNHSADLVFHDGSLYIAAWHNSRVKRVELSDMTVHNFAGRGVREQYDGDGGPALDAALDLPAALAVRPDGAIVVMDQGNQVIRAIDGSNVIRTIVGRCVADTLAACAPDATLVACPGSSKLVCSSDPDACLYPCGPGYAGDGATALDVRMAQPFGAVAMPGGHIAFTRDGSLLFVDTNNHRVREVDPAGVVSTIAGIGSIDAAGRGGYAGDGGLATLAQLNHPRDVAIAEDGTLYLTDVDNSCIRKIDPAGIISTAVGICGERGFSGDGASPTRATLDRPMGIELVGDLLYIADSFNHRIRVANVASR
ncbi:MAG TPA: hypothetical protein VFQ53_27115 [Kofleriaceae bacterium]|nr:hypothetical protein [Kofleriaceae bacterium]